MAIVRKSDPVKKLDASKSTVSKIVFEDAGVYINLLTDFGFKRIFGIEANKDLLIDFLNAVLSIDGGIKDLTYTNPEKLGRRKTDARVFFDLHCITGKDERIIIEMQKLSQDFYKDRALYYASFLIQEQGQKRKRWDYMLHPVYSVNVVNFKLNKTRRTSKHTSYIQLMDKDTHELFYDKLTFVYLELPRFSKKIDELETNIDRWMFVLKHITKLNDLPAPLRNRIFSKLFTQAKIANMTKEELDEYQQSLTNYRAMYLKEYEYKKNLAVRDKMIAEKDQIIAENYTRIAEKDAKIAEKDAMIAELKRRFGIN
jgi:predicted transposase/invertase (TIGR01784 family)